MSDKHLWYDSESERFYVYSAKYNKLEKILDVNVFPFPNNETEYSNICEYLHERWGENVYEKHKRSVNYTMMLEEEFNFSKDFTRLMTALRTRKVSKGQIGALDKLEDLTNKEFWSWWRSMERD